MLHNTTCIATEREQTQAVKKSRARLARAELKEETSGRTLSAPGSDALAVFAYSYHR